jgi:hypothetical protein
MTNRILLLITLLLVLFSTAAFGSVLYTFQAGESVATALASVRTQDEPVTVLYTFESDGSVTTTVGNDLVFLDGDFDFDDIIIGFQNDTPDPIMSLDFNFDGSFFPDDDFDSMPPGSTWTDPPFVITYSFENGIPSNTGITLGVHYFSAVTPTDLANSITAVVPEPGAVQLLSLGLLALLAWKFRRQIKSRLFA